MSRLDILSPTEQKEFDYPPTLPADLRIIFFAMTNDLERRVFSLRTTTNKVGFMLQYGYFKASGRFFHSNRFRSEDVNYVCRLLKLSPRDVNLIAYKERIPALHQQKILILTQHTPFDDGAKDTVKAEIIRQAERQVAPKQVFLHAVSVLKQQKIELPSYHRLAELITQVYIDFESHILLQVKKHLAKDTQKSLDAWLDENNSHYQTLFNQLKKIAQTTQPKGIQASLTLFNQVKEYFFSLKPIIEALSLSPNSSIYYATWVQKAKLSQLKQFPDPSKRYLHLIAFIQHQFYQRQDYLVDILLKSVQSVKNAATHKLSQSDTITRQERKNAVQYLAHSHRHYRSLIEEINTIIKSVILSDTSKVQKISELLAEDTQQKSGAEQKKVLLLERSLDSLAADEDYFGILEKLSIKLQRRTSDILKSLVFNDHTSDPILMDAIHYFKHNNGQINQKAPTAFLNQDQRDALVDQDKKFRPSLYKILLLIHVANAIKSGKLNLQYSYRYLSINDYLISEARWKTQRDQLLKFAGLSSFSNYHEVIEILQKRLNGKYNIVNQRFIEKINPYLSMNKEGGLFVTTSALDDKDTQYIGALLEQTGYVPLFQILSDIQKIVPFTDCFKHHSIKHVKQRPNPETYFAGLMSLGCNIGVRKMAQISVGIKENTLLNTVTWYFTLKNLQAANQRIINLINKLTLSSAFIYDKEQIHSSSDGQKVNVAVDSLIANRSFKYFGKDQGISVYTFIDERQALFHSLVMSPVEREAAYVIDGLLQNDVAPTHIHSTDTHGFTESIFAATHFLDVAFAPRIKNIGSQYLYAFSSKKTYERLGYKILPSRTINQKLIEAHWEDLLRFMVTMKLKEVTASQLFKRLSSYAKDNPLYQALKEFGRIVKSIFILTYLDDVRLRQRIEKQLNRVELSNKFSKAVFFANDHEFKQAMVEEQEVATACKVLIQNAIVLWNYLYLSQLLANCKDVQEQNEMVGMIKNGSVLTWRHINLHGEYDFRRQSSNQNRFDLAKILALKVA